MERNEKWVAFVIAPLLVMLPIAAAAMLPESGTETVSGIATLVAALTFALFLRKKRLKAEGRPTDERTQKITAWAASYSWFLTLVAISLLFWLDYLKIVQMGARQVLTGLLIIHLGSMIFAKWRFSQKGDVA